MTSVSILQLTEKPIVELFPITTDGARDAGQAIPQFVGLMLREMEFFRRGIDGEDTGQELQTNSDLVVHGLRGRAALQASSQLFEIVEEHGENVEFLFEEKKDMIIDALLLLLLLLLKDEEQLRQ